MASNDYRKTWPLLAALAGAACSSTPSAGDGPARVGPIPVAIRVPPEVAPLLQKAPLFAHRLSDDRDENRHMDVAVSMQDKGSFEAGILAASLASKDRVLLPALPDIQSRNWQRTPPPASGPLFDTRQVTAGYLLNRMQRAGYAATGSVPCGEDSKCEGEAFVLEIALAHERLAIAGQPAQYSARIYRTRARILTADNTSVWQHDCELSIAPRAPAVRGQQAAQLQGLLDAAAVECGERLFQELNRQLGGK